MDLLLVKLRRSRRKFFNVFVFIVFAVAVGSAVSYCYALSELFWNSHQFCLLIFG